MHVTGLPADRHIDGFGGNPSAAAPAASRKSHAKNSVPPAYAGVKCRLRSPETILAAIEETPHAASVLARFGQIAVGGPATIH